MSTGELAPAHTPRRKLLWMELQRRYDGVLTKPIKIEIPYLRTLDAKKIRAYIFSKIDSTNWPSFLQEWHKREFRLIATNQPSIADILCNVTRPHAIKRLCKCKQFCKLNPTATTGTRYVNGHVFMIGRDFKGDDFSALRSAACNVPQQTFYDTFRAWDRINASLPSEWRVAASDSKAQLFKLTRYRPKPDYDSVIPTTKAVHLLRKRLKGMVIGPLDKNNGELSVVCPKLYHEALRANYSQKAGYERVFPAKLSAYRKKRYSADELPAQILRTDPPPTNQAGTERDVLEMLKRIYKHRGWEQYAKFNNKGGFNQPYILFKAKNVTDLAKRRKKWKKARPIAPGTKHPAKQLLHYVGRAWSFITARLPGEHFVISKTDDVPDFLQRVNTHLGGSRPFNVKVFDIEGCFPSMPKDSIRQALRETLDTIQSQCKYDGVLVPTRSESKPCRWRRQGDDRHDPYRQLIPFPVLLDVMNFSLDFAFTRMPDGRLLHQRLGIPMGDPLSPGMTIGACAWMEQKWLAGLPHEHRQHFMAKRFMDDIIIAYRADDAWDHQRFIHRFIYSDCYHKPLTLTPGNEGIFLETQFWQQNGRLRYKLKNDNAGDGQHRIWRYHHWHSNTSITQKRATLTACLRRVHKMSSDASNLSASALDKIAEFRRLRYPISVLERACAYLGATSGVGTWITVRNALRATGNRPKSDR